jgi:hypothetical protein
MAASSSSHGASPVFLWPSAAALVVGAACRAPVQFSTSSLSSPLPKSGRLCSLLSVRLVASHRRPCHGAGCRSTCVLASPVRLGPTMELAQLLSHLYSSLSISVRAAARRGRHMSATLAKCSMKYRSELHLDLRSPNPRRHNTLGEPSLSRTPRFVKYQMNKMCI